MNRAEIECCEWDGYIEKKGYGRIHTSRGKILAHRRSYELFVGPIPNSLHVLHTCDNRKCINPAHLFLGTEFDNGRDAAIKDRRKQKLTADQVRLIRLELASGKTHKQVAIKFGINQSNVTRIKNRERRQYIS